MVIKKYRFYHSFFFAASALEFRYLTNVIDFVNIQRR